MTIHELGLGEKGNYKSTYMYMIVRLKNINLNLTLA